MASYITLILLFLLPAFDIPQPRTCEEEIALPGVISVIFSPLILGPFFPPEFNWTEVVGKPPASSLRIGEEKTSRPAYQIRVPKLHNISLSG